MFGNFGAAVPFVCPPELGNAAAMSGRQPDNADRLPDLRPVRLGRAPAALDSTQEPVPMVLSARSAESSGLGSIPPGPASAPVKEVLADMANRRSAGIDVAKSLADLNTKVDAMKESFDLLEAHVAVGLAQSIAETLRTEIGALEQQFALGHRYRDRYRRAVSVALLLAAAIVADQYRPFIDALFEPVRQGLSRLF
jgi:hypothetical protein